MRKYLVKVINTESRLVEVIGETEAKAIEKARDGLGNFVVRPTIETETTILQDSALFVEQ